MQKFAIIGLGGFGSTLARMLGAKGAEVIAIDADMEKVEAIRTEVTLAVQLNSQDSKALKLQGVDKVDIAVVCIGEDFESNVLTTVPVSAAISKFALTTSPSESADPEASKRNGLVMKFSSGVAVSWQVGG